MASGRIISAASVICNRQILVTLRSPFATFIEICYPGLATAVLLMLRHTAKASDTSQGQFGEGSSAPGIGAEYICWSFIWAVVFLSTNLKFVQNIMEEKENKVREFIQVYGASEIAYWTGNYLFMASFSAVQALVICLVAAACLRDWSMRIVKIFFLIFSFNVSSVSTGMLVTSFSDGARAALFIYTSLYLVMMVPYIKSIPYVTEHSSGGATAWNMFMSPQSTLVCGLDQYLGGFVPPTNVLTGGNISLMYNSSACQVPQPVLYLLFLLDAIVYALLGWYFHQVIPGPMNIAKRWDFIFRAHYWQEQTMLTQPRRKVWAETQNFVPQQTHSDLFEYACPTCAARNLRLQASAPPTANIISTSQHFRSTHTLLNHSNQYLRSRLEEHPSTNISPPMNSSGPSMTGNNENQPQLNDIIKTALAEDGVIQRTPTQLFRADRSHSRHNSTYNGAQHGRGSALMMPHRAAAACTCKPLIVVDQLHKIYIRKRLTWQRLKNWLKRKLDLGVVKPPSGVHVLKGISFKVYEGQVIVIMGRNGSGTSTLLSIIGGLQDCSSGNVYIAGHDIHRQLMAARRRIGYCPQTNFFLEKMTIREQLSFAATLKGVPHHISKCDIEVILKMLELYDKIDWLPHRLSHGEKKRLAIAMALLGNPRCIVIDDLSTGLDVVSRRVIWRTLAEMKHNRAIIVSTHCPNEAEIIADRLGVIEAGCLKAFGTPLFLKSRFEEGYVLSVQDTGKKSDALGHKVIDLLKKYSQDSGIVNSIGIELTFRISYKARKYLPNILKILEHKQHHWGMANIQLSTTRLDDVLEKIWDDTAADAERRKARLPSPDATTLTSFITRINNQSASGGAFRGTSSDGLSTIAALQGEDHASCCFTNSESGSSGYSETSSAEYLEWSAKSELTSHLSLLAGTVETCEWSDDDFVVRVPGYIGNPSVFNEARNRWRLARTAWNNMVRNIVSVFWKRLHMMRKDGWLLHIQLLLPPLIGCFFNVTWLFSARYSTRTLRDFVEDELADICVGEVVGVPSKFILNTPMSWTLVMRTTFSIMSIELIPSVWGNYVTSERASGSKIHQHAAGIPLWLYWLGELFWDCLIFTLVSTLCIVVMLATLSPLVTIGTWYWLFAALCLYAVSAAAGTFFLSFVFQSGTTIQVVMMSGGVLVPLLVGALHAVGPSYNSRMLTYIFLLIPHSAFAQICYSLVFDCACGADHRQCPLKFLGFTMNGLPFLYMAVECVVYLGFVVFLDALQHDPHLSGLAMRFKCFDPATLRRKLKIDAAAASTRHTPFPALNRMFRQNIEDENEDFTVNKFGTDIEEKRVKRAVAEFCKPKETAKAEGEQEAPPLLVADAISKWKISRHLGAVKASNFFGRRRYIICDRATFTVHDEELLGLVGLNGSGMSSIMSILSGKTNPTEGKLWIDGLDIRYQPHARWGRVGFCSETDQVLEGRMTGREILEMFGRIGMIEREYLRRTLIPEALAMVCLKDMKNKPVNSYSQGDRRKLSFILSLFTGAKILILDSPTLGMDITSRRRIWSVINHLKRLQHKAIIVASSSPNECEILSDKIAYVRSGRIVAIGDAASVKAHLSSCYEVLLNVYAADALDQPVVYNGQLINETPCLIYTRFLEKLEAEFAGAQVVEILGTWARFVIPAQKYFDPTRHDVDRSTRVVKRRPRNDGDFSLSTGDRSAIPRLPLRNARMHDPSITSRDNNSPSACTSESSRRYTTMRNAARTPGTGADNIRETFARMQQENLYHKASPPMSSDSSSPRRSFINYSESVPNLCDAGGATDSASGVIRSSPKRHIQNEKHLLVAQNSRMLWNRELNQQVSKMLSASPRRNSIRTEGSSLRLDGSILSMSDLKVSPNATPPIRSALRSPGNTSARKRAVIEESSASSANTCESSVSRNISPNTTIAAIYEWLEQHKVSSGSKVRLRYIIIIDGVQSLGNVYSSSQPGDLFRSR